MADRLGAAVRGGVRAAGRVGVPAVVLARTMVAQVAAVVDLVEGLVTVEVAADSANRGATVVRRGVSGSRAVKVVMTAGVHAGTIGDRDFGMSVMRRRNRQRNNGVLRCSHEKVRGSTEETNRLPTARIATNA